MAAFTKQWQNPPYLCIKHALELLVHAVRAQKIAQVGELQI